jgi:hypothetical protein
MAFVQENVHGRDSLSVEQSENIAEKHGSGS